METKELLDALFQTAVESDPAYQAAVKQDMEATRPYYDRIFAALGEEEGERIWDGLMSVGAAQQNYVFRAGLCLGLRLMALCQ